MTGIRTLRALLLVALALVLVSCSITRVKWRIKWDKDLKKSKAAYMSAPLETGVTFGKGQSADGFSLSRVATFATSRALVHEILPRATDSRSTGRSPRAAARRMN